ncbi:hypothetical protein HBI69_130730 [Parastagonospora nodorum]|nr:hypothetical protein HBI69_130730 [Parastagonospora nodorum]
MQSWHEFRRCLVDHKSPTYPSEGDSLLHFFLAHKFPQALGCHLCRACGLWGKSSKLGPKKNLYHGTPQWLLAPSNYRTLVCGERRSSGPHRRGCRQARWTRVSPNFGSTNISHLEAIGLVTYIGTDRVPWKYHHALSLAHPHQAMVPLWANKKS